VYDILHTSVQIVQNSTPTKTGCSLWGITTEKSRTKTVTVKLIVLSKEKQYRYTAAAEFVSGPPWRKLNDLRVALPRIFIALVDSHDGKIIISPASPPASKKGELISRLKHGIFTKSWLFRGLKISNEIIKFKDKYFVSCRLAKQLFTMTYIR
jgi:hypothetical protein